MNASWPMLKQSDRINIYRRLSKDEYPAAWSNNTKELMRNLEAGWRKNKRGREPFVVTRERCRLRKLENSSFNCSLTNVVRMRNASLIDASAKMFASKLTRELLNRIIDDLLHPAENHINACGNILGVTRAQKRREFEIYAKSSPGMTITYTEVKGKIMAACMYDPFPKPVSHNVYLGPDNDTLYEIDHRRFVRLCNRALESQNINVMHELVFICTRAQGYGTLLLNYTIDRFTKKSNANVILFAKQARCVKADGNVDDEKTTLVARTFYGKNWVNVRAAFARKTGLQYNTGGEDIYLDINGYDERLWVRMI
jgi:hypothetical protein